MSRDFVRVYFTGKAFSDRCVCMAAMLENIFTEALGIGFEKSCSITTRIFDWICVARLFR